MHAHAGITPSCFTLESIAAPIAGFAWLQHSQDGRLHAGHRGGHGDFHADCAHAGYHMARESHGNVPPRTATAHNRAAPRFKAHRRERRSQPLQFALSVSDHLMNPTPSETSSRPPIRALTQLEARVLGVLVEKQHTVPDTYPLSLNSLASGCNQKTGRAPVMNVTEAEILAAIDAMKRLSLVFEGSSSRVPRFEHNMNRVFGLPGQSIALLTTLMLRGPQTAAELRLNSARLHGFADISSVEAFLDELAAHDPPRVVKLARMPGERESRWMHLLCGEVSASEFAPACAADEAVPPTAFEAVRAEQKRLAAEVLRLEALVQHMAAELGIDLDKLTQAP
jgi:uncharacterized protein